MLKTNNLTTGSLSTETSNREGWRRLITWTFNSASINESVAVDVSYVCVDGKLAFRATCDKLDEPICCSDIDELRRLVDKSLIELLDDVGNVAWENWLRVTVKGDLTGGRQGAMSAELSVSVDRVRRGVHRRTGEVVGLGRNNTLVPFPKATSIHDPDPNAGEKYKLYAEPAEVSYIPETPANLAALSDVLDRMDTLKRNLAHLLGQDNVVQGLQQIERAMPRLTPIGGRSTA